MGPKIKPIFLLANGKEPVRKDSNERLVRDLSLEELVEGRNLKLSEETERVAVRHIPTLIFASVYYLRRKHERIKLLSQVQVYGTMLGASCIESQPSIKRIERAKRAGVESGSVADLLTHFIPHHYEWSPPFALCTARASITVTKWANGVMTDLSATFGLTRPMMAMLVLMIGLSKSERWLPPGLRSPLLAESERFTHWIEGMAI